MPASSRSSLPPLLNLDRDDPAPLFRQIDRQLREAIIDGRIRPGAPLPSTRALAAEHGVSRNTVRLAFEQLLAEGYLESVVGAGTRVAASVPVARPGTPDAGAKRVAAPGVARSPLMRRLERVQVPPVAGSLAPQQTAFRVGLPALDRFPFETWARLAGRRWRRITAAQLGYGDGLGEPRLREAIARHVGATRGVTCEANQVLIVSGSQGALDLIARLVLEPGQDVWVEDPGYFGARGPIAAAGANAVPIPVDDDGLIVAEGLRRAPGARAAFLTPSHQFPTGVMLGLSRRAELLEWARRARAWIVEDDYDSEFRYDARPLTALQGLDGGDRVIYVGTLSKTLFPSLRLGYLILPYALVESFALARRFVDTHPPTLLQLVAADFIEEGHYARHLRRMRGVYRDRQDALLAAVAERTSGRIGLRPSGAGMHMMAWLPPGTDERALAAAALAQGISVLGLSTFRASEGRPGIVLGYGGVPPARMGDAVGDLVRALDACDVRGIAAPG
jgi:GntR family transcriptional regulator/MocR family aminotransferase